MCCWPEESQVLKICRIVDNKLFTEFNFLHFYFFIYIQTYTLDQAFLTVKYAILRIINILNFLLVPNT